MAGFPSFGITPTQAPAGNNNLELLLELKPGLFDGLIKILNLFQDNNMINIKDSNVLQSARGSTYFTCDISPLVGPNINLDFADPKKTISVLKIIKSSTDIKIYNNPEFNSYKLVSQELDLDLPKPSQEIENSLSLIPDLNDLTFLGQPITLEGDVKTRARAYLSKSNEDYLDLLIEKDQLKAVFIPDSMVYHFSEFKNPNLNQNNAELVLKTFSFLSIDGERYGINLSKYNNRYLLITQIQTAFKDVIINVFEYVEQNTHENMLL